jgi:molybdate transport system substrate-binding protein
MFYVACAPAYSGERDEVPLVAAATNVGAALDSIRIAFQRDTGRQIKVVAGASGNLMRQIMRGAPYQLFLSANERYADQLIQLGLTHGKGKLYALGRLSVFIPSASRLPPTRYSPITFIDTRIKRLAIANPEHAPYGYAAREALQHLGEWQELRRSIVIGENASQALQFALTGSVDAAIVPTSFMRHESALAAGAFTALPAKWHQPIRQKAVLIKVASDDAVAFFDYLNSSAARKIWQQNGYGLPDLTQPLPESPTSPELSGL